jgi:hypothetical protein
MTAEDLETMRGPRPKVRLARIRQVHHIIARLIASGMSNTDIAAEMGYNPSRIALLRSDPAMVELVANYMTQDNETWLRARDQFYDRIARSGLKAWAQIEDQLDEADETGDRLSIDRLVKIADSASDRVGYHKRTTTTNINIDFASRLEAAIRKRDELRAIEAE